MSFTVRELGGVFFLVPPENPYSSLYDTSSVMCKLFIEDGKNCKFPLLLAYFEYTKFL